jgi:GNAT superfamily N-acetyltransferase
VSKIEILPVVSRKERDDFIKFPWRIYRDDPAWVPPLLLERKEFLDRKKHPFYLHGDAAIFLARRDGEVVGRIMASDDPRYNELQKTNLGCFGLFDCIDDVEVAAALFRAAEDWVRAKGRTKIMGPIDYSTNYVCGLLIDGFEYPPTILIAHNPPYYERLIEQYGFTKEVDWYAWWFDDFPKPLERLQRVVTGRAARTAFRVRPFDRSRLVEESQRLRAVFNQAWSKNWGFVPFTEAEVEHMAKEMKLLIDPKLTMIAEVDDSPAAFLICVPDIHVILKQLNGRLFPLGIFKLLFGLKRLKKVRLVALGVVEEYRRAGVAETLVFRLMDEGRRRGYTGELSMTLEDNHQVNRFIEGLGARRYKTFRIYHKALA